MLLLVQWLFGDTLTRFAADLLSGLAAIPHWIVNVVIVGTRILVVVVIGGGFVVTLLRGRFRFLFTVGVAAVFAGAGRVAARPRRSRAAARMSST